MAVWGDWNKMLCSVQPEVAKAVDPVMSKEGLGLRTFDNYLVHMVGLIKQDRLVAPSCLFGTPILKLWRYNRVNVHARRRVAQHLYGVCMAFHSIV